MRSCIILGIRTLAYGHKDIKRIVSERNNQMEAACASADNQTEDDDAPHEEEKEEEETPVQLNQLAERIYFKVRSISKEDEETAFDLIEGWSGGRIRHIDCEKFVELLSDERSFELDKLDTMMTRIKNLLSYRKRKNYK